jgi:hypothetical protein
MTARTLDLRAQRSAPLWRVALCLLLAVLCLYNPFFTIYGDSAVVNVQHSLSCRATIASSELRCATLNTEQALLPRLEASASFEPLLAVESEQRFPAPPRDLFRALPQPAGDSLWFRPPPAL